MIKLVKKTEEGWKTQFQVEFDDAWERRFAQIVESMEVRNMWYVRPLSIGALQNAVMKLHGAPPELERLAGILEANPTFWIDLDCVEREEE